MKQYEDIIEESLRELNNPGANTNSLQKGNGKATVALAMVIGNLQQSVNSIRKKIKNLDRTIEKRSRSSNIHSLIIIILTVGLVLTGIAQVVVARIYTRSTQEMAQVTREEFELTNRPYLYLHEIDRTENEKDQLEIWAKINNRGKIPAKLSSIYWEAHWATSTLQDTFLKNHLIHPEEIINQRFFIMGKDTLNLKHDIYIKMLYTSNTTNKTNFHCIEYNLVYTGDPQDNLTVVDSNVCD